MRRQRLRDRPDGIILAAQAALREATIEQGMALDLVLLEEIRPKFGIYLPHFVTSIKERYGFVSWPKDLSEAVSAGAKFQHGRFIVDDTQVVIKELGVYRDGIVVDTFSTHISDLVLGDLLNWAKDEFPLRERATPARRTYTNVAIVEFERNVERGLGKLAAIGNLLAESLHSAYGWDYEYNVHRIAFSVDPLCIPQFRNTQFFIERRLKNPYSENRYYSGAPMQTERELWIREIRPPDKNRP
jgi:hypothetical protein